jgi:hypothetical protein
MRSLPARLALWLTLLCAAAGGYRSYASTVLEMPFADILAHAELIFEGHVRARESHLASDGLVYTTVHFDVLELVKGDFRGSVLALRFLGGEVDGQHLQVTDMVMPEVGETGFYFVETLARAQVNPLVGWSQGHFLVEPQADGRAGVLTANHAPVLGLPQPDMPVSAQGMGVPSKGVAKGVVVTQGLVAPAVARALSPAQFKDAVRAMLEVSGK